MSKFQVGDILEFPTGAGIGFYYYIEEIDNNYYRLVHVDSGLTDYFAPIDKSDDYNLVTDAFRPYD